MVLVEDLVYLGFLDLRNLPPLRLGIQIFALPIGNHRRRTEFHSGDLGRDQSILVRTIVRFGP